MKRADYIGLGFCSNDHLAVLPFIPMDTKVRMISHAIMGGGPAANSTAGAAALGMSAVRNPHLKPAERVKLLCSVMPQLPIMERFAALIVKEEREDILVFIAYEYMNLYREAKGICAVRFITAAPVAPDFKAGLEQIVGNENKMKVEVEYIVDESIIGGFRMEVASRRIDASVEGQLRRIRKQLVKPYRKLV